MMKKLVLLLTPLWLFGLSMILFYIDASLKIYKIDLGIVWNFVLVLVFLTSQIMGFMLILGSIGMAFRVKEGQEVNGICYFIAFILPPLAFLFWSKGNNPYSVFLNSFVNVAICSFLTLCIWLPGFLYAWSYLKRMRRNADHLHLAKTLQELNNR